MLFNPSDTTIIDQTLCEDECVIINGTEYCDGGIFEDLLLGTDGCDSAVVIIAETIDLLPQLLPDEVILELGVEKNIL